MLKVRICFPLGTAQPNGYDFNQPDKHTTKIISSCDVANYQNYIVEWDQDSIKWYFDNKQFHAIGIRDSVNFTAAFHKPFYIILNLAIGGSWPKNPDETTQFPGTMYVDYVRVYQKYQSMID